MVYQSGARIVRQARDQTGPEYIRPYTVASKPAVTPAAFEVHINVRWGLPDMGIETQSARGGSEGSGSQIALQATCIVQATRNERDGAPGSHWSDGELRMAGRVQS
jgi:hypothetical protein